MVRSILEREGYRVEVASDGIEAVLKLGLSDYDVIVLDLMMPNLDGFSFIEVLSAHDPGRLQKVIVTSAAPPTIIHTRMQGAVPFAVLAKPFDITDLTSGVRSCVDAQGS